MLDKLVKCRLLPSSFPRKQLVVNMLTSLYYPECLFRLDHLETNEDSVTKVPPTKTKQSQGERMMFNDFFLESNLEMKIVIQSLFPLKQLQMTVELVYFALITLPFEETVCRIKTMMRE